MRACDGLVCLFLLSQPVFAAEITGLSPDAQDFVSGTVFSTLYHELGHAFIDVLELPVLGQEEDAADVLAMVMTHNMWEEDQARKVASATALSFLLTASEGNEPAYWDVHGADEQRYFNTVCLFYGAAPETRADFAEAFDLPEGRADQCEGEFTLADESWGGLLEDATLSDGDAPGTSFVFEDSAEGSEIESLLREDVLDLNNWYKLPETITVEMAPCGEANAFYNPEDRKITICTEYVDYLAAQAVAADL